MQVHKAAILLAMILIAAVLISGSSLRETVPQSPLRLHVKANSDALADQALKYEVRNAVIAVLSSHLQAAGDAAAAQAEIEKVLPEVLVVVENTVKDAGYHYKVSATLGEAQFPTRLYGDRVYRAGRYNALQIYLGEGRGENWWCVLFPPLCFVEVAQDNAIPVTTIEPITPPRVKSRLLEWWQRFLSRGA